MNQRIIYQNNEGGVSVIIPAPDCGISTEEIARKDVPAGVAYKIVSTDDIPSDRTFRDAWEADMSNPDGVGIGAEAWFAEQAAQQQAQEEVANDNSQPE
jgi:hypothetical protein